VQWLEDFDSGSTAPVKLKFDDGERHVEVCVPFAFSQTVWDRFKAGQSIEDACSVFGVDVQPSCKAEKERR
jgi:hypothetical protein